MSLYIGINNTYLRSQNNHAIKRKEKIAKSKFRIAEDEYTDSQQKENFKEMFNKKLYNYKKNGKIEKHNVKSKLDLMQHQIDEYV